MLFTRSILKLVKSEKKNSSVWIFFNVSFFALCRYAYFMFFVFKHDFYLELKKKKSNRNYLHKKTKQNKTDYRTFFRNIKLDQVTGYFSCFRCFIAA